MQVWALLTDGRGMAGLVLVLPAAAGLALITYYLPSIVAAAVVLVAVVAALWTATSSRRRPGRGPQQQLEAVRTYGGSSKPRSIYDLETGFCAEWYFLLRVDEEIARCVRGGQTFGVLFVEPRRRLGQRVMTRLLERLEQTFRTADLVGRFDEQRFAVLLIGAEPHGTQAAGQRVTSLVGRRNVRVSAAVYPRDGQTWRELVVSSGASWSQRYPASEAIWSHDGRSTFDRHTDQHHEAA